MVGVDLVGQGALRVGGVREPGRDDPPVDRVEGRVVDQEGVVLHLDGGDARLGELDEGVAIERHDRERPPVGRPG